MIPHDREFSNLDSKKVTLDLIASKMKGITKKFRDLKIDSDISDFVDVESDRNASKKCGSSNFGAFLEKNSVCSESEEDLKSKLALLSPSN